MYQKWVNIDGQVYWVNCTPDTSDIEIVRRLLLQLQASQSPSPSDDISDTGSSVNQD